MFNVSVLWYGMYSSVLLLWATHPLPFTLCPLLLWISYCFSFTKSILLACESWEVELKTEIWKGTSWLKVRVRFTGLKSTTPRMHVFLRTSEILSCWEQRSLINRYSQDDVILESRGPLVSHDWYPYKKRRRHLGRMPGKQRPKHERCTYKLEDTKQC